MNNIVNKYIKSANRITSIISILTFTTIFLFLFTHPSQKNELKLKEDRKNTLDSLIIRSDAVFFEIRTFYEGSVEGKNYSFASFIHSLATSDFQLNLIREITDLTSLSVKDKLFFNHEYYELKVNIHGLRTIIGDLIEQKKKRIPFDKLTLSDLSDLGYHKGKNSGDFNRSVNSLKMALFVPESPGYQSETIGIIGLKNRYNYYRNESENKGWSDSTKPLKTGRTQNVIDLLNDLKKYKTLNQLKSEIRNIEEEIEKLENKIRVSLSLPIINISIKYSYMTWLIPITFIILLILLNFYLGKINLVFKSIFQKNESIESISVPWFFIEDDKLSKGILISARFLKIAILFSVIIAEIIPLIIATNLNFYEYFFPAVFIVASIWFLYSTFKELKKIKKAYNTQNIKLSR